MAIFKAHNCEMKKKETFGSKLYCGMSELKSKLKGNL